MRSHWCCVTASKEFNQIFAKNIKSNWKLKSENEQKNQNNLIFKIFFFFSQMSMLMFFYQSLISTSNSKVGHHIKWDHIHYTIVELCCGWSSFSASILLNETNVYAKNKYCNKCTNSNHQKVCIIDSAGKIFYAWVHFTCWARVTFTHRY